MAKSVYFLLAILSVILITVHSQSQHLPKEIILYSQVIRSGPNANLIPVAGPDPPRNNMFGATVVVNFPLREDINLQSPPVGRVQGFGVSSSMDGTLSHFSISYYFDNGKYSGSTLQLQGVIRFIGNAVTGELSVTSGTESFRYVSGYAQLQTVREIPEMFNTTIDQVKIYLKEDDNY